MLKIQSQAETTIPSGALNRRISIQSQITTPNASGRPSDWTTILTTWAHIEQLKGSESLLASQIYGSTVAIIAIRYRPEFNISPGMRILYGSRVYDITYVEVPAEARTSIHLYVTEQRAQGSLH